MTNDQTTPTDETCMACACPCAEHTEHNHPTLTSDDSADQEAKSDAKEEAK